MGDRAYFSFDTGGEPLVLIDAPEISSHASYKLDEPLACSPEDLFELRHGQWFLVYGEDRIPIPGRWIARRTHGDLTMIEKHGTG